MFVLLFTYVVRRRDPSLAASGLSYVDYLLPGIFVQSVTFRRA